MSRLVNPKEKPKFRRNGGEKVIILMLVSFHRCAGGRVGSKTDENQMGHLQY